MEKQLTIEDFYNKYTTEHNQVLLKTLKEGISADDMCSFGGCMYETYGEEVDYVKQQPNKRIWTIIDEEDKLYIIAGYHFVNRLGYLVTDEEWSDENETYLVD